MNEAAHLAGLYDDVESFLPSLPDHFAQDYLEELNANAYEGSIVFPDGPHLRVLVWLRDALSYFRSSSLPSNGIEIHVNIIESIFRSSLVSSYKDDADVHRPHATAPLVLGGRRQLRSMKEQPGQYWMCTSKFHPIDLAALIYCFCQ